MLSALRLSVWLYDGRIQLLILPAVWGLSGVLYAQPIADIISAIVTAVMAVRLHRELRIAGPQVSTPPQEH